MTQRLVALLSLILATALASLFLLLITSAAISSCTEEERSEEALRQLGYTPIRVGGYGWFGCDGDAIYITRFRAVNMAGAEVEGVVCCGYSKMCAVKVDE